MRKRLIKGLLALPVLALSATFVMAQSAPDKNIVELAQDTSDLSTLVTAVVEADLVGTLSDENTMFTVFAPTNAAFDALPAGTLDSLLQEENVGQLTDILTFHVVEGKVMAADLSDGQMVTTVNGQKLMVEIDGSNVMIGGAMVSTADVEATNGVVHIIDSVLLPDTPEAHSPADTGIVSSTTLTALSALAIISAVAGFSVTYYNFRRI